MDKELIDYFINETNKKFDKMDDRFNEVDSQLKEIFQLRWKITGVVTFFSFCLTALIELFIHSLGGV